MITTSDKKSTNYRYNIDRNSYSKAFNEFANGGWLFIHFSGCYLGRHFHKEVIVLSNGEIIEIELNLITSLRYHMITTSDNKKSLNRVIVRTETKEVNSGRPLVILAQVCPE
ncbi:hypothetical protein RCL_jg17613.t2 [Rhizophagus clarus]|uniref:Uncharacterized protein n=1 Tax=Rhizophagus clarus TaxID=94130 RepID=A0A8H3L504_9GLOM|nr:hypothetical protein RCL_jg17613.t2 [Rhizophagus clarus]